MFIDTHCHLTDNYVSDNLTDIIKHANDAGVDTLICPTANPADIPNAIKIIEQYDNIFATIGIHPEYAGIDATKYLYDSVLTHPKIIGIGEIGLDYHERNDNRNAQIQLFEQQLELAKKYNLPVAIHSRDAEEDTAAILHDAVGGVMHCFTSSWDLAKIMLDRGFYFSASGILTFKNAFEIRETFSKIPLDRLVIETDSPYCAPVPHRGNTCEPAFVVETAKVLANIKKVTIEEMGKILRQNTYNLYPKITVKN